MKNSTLLLLLSLFNTTHTKINTNLQEWQRVYDINKMSNDEVATLASALFYLIDQGPNYNQNTSDMLSQVNTVVKKFGLTSTCFNALIKAYENAKLLSIKQPAYNKECIWKKTLLNYYQELMHHLEGMNALVTFGNQKGKKLPTYLPQKPVNKPCYISAYNNNVFVKKERFKSYFHVTIKHKLL